jgi:hypothetical protein
MNRIAGATRLALGLVGLAFASSLFLTGCGSSGNGTTVQVSPEFQKKTDDVLKTMKKTMETQNRARLASQRKR